MDLFSVDFAEELYPLYGVERVRILEFPNDAAEGLECSEERDWMTLSLTIAYWSPRHFATNVLRDRREKGENIRHCLVTQPRADDRGRHCFRVLVPSLSHCSEMWIG